MSHGIPASPPLDRSGDGGIRYRGAQGARPDGSRARSVSGISGVVALMVALHRAACFLGKDWAHPNPPAGRGA